jgi:predicted metalloprotease
MTFNDNARSGGGRVSKRGRNTGFAVGGGGIGVIAILLISQAFGVDLSGLLGGGTAGTTASDTTLSNCDTGADANANLECRLDFAAQSLDAYWETELGADYTPPPLVLFQEATNTGCGSATSAVGPFYCPTDQTVYLDTGFYEELRTRFGADAGPLAQMYVIAHEFGHHIQNLQGTMTSIERGDTGPTSDAVRLELQADCFAGAWAGEASTVSDESGTAFIKPITKAQLADALDAASAIGDDRIQESTQGQVNPEAWTHGSSEQRQQWFETGYEQGSAGCDTFAAGAL